MTTHRPAPPAPVSADDADRKAHIRRWIARRSRAAGRAGAGLLAPLLTLPALAAAQGREGFVTASGIDGVEGVALQPDGSARLEMANGVDVSVPAADVRLGADGRVLVADRIVEVAAEVLAAEAVGTAGAGGGAAGGGGFGGGAIAAGGGLAAVAGGAAGGGGGSGGGGGATPPPPPVLDSSLLSAGGFANGDIDLGPAPEGTEELTVTLAGSDGPTIERTVTPDSAGDWVFPEPPDGFPQGDLRVTAIARDAEGAEIDRVAQDIRIDTVPPTISLDDTGVGADGVLDIAERDAGLTISGTTDAEDGQTVTLTLGTASGQLAEVTATVAAGAWSAEIAPEDLAGLSDGDAVTVEATVADAAGNPADTPATATFDADLAAPEIEIDTISGDDVIGLADATDADGLTVTGTTSAGAGQTVTLSFAGADYTDTVTAEAGGANTWAVTVPQSALESLRAEAGADAQISGITLRATVTDAAGNPATPAETTIDADFRGPSITLDAIAGDDRIDVAEREGGVTISGRTTNVGEGRTVTVTIDDPDVGDLTATTDATGAWSALLPQASVAALPDPGTVQVEARVTDADGIAATATTELSSNFQPILTLDQIGEGGVVDLSDTAPPEITGTTLGIEAGRAVTVVASDPDGEILNATAPVNADGSWRLEVRQATIDSLDAGATVDVTATATNADGRAAEPASAQVEIYLPAAFVVAGTAETGATLTLSAIAGETLDSNEGVETTMTFDPAEAEYVSGSADDNFDLFTVNEDTASTGRVIFTGGTAGTQLDAGEVMYSFDMTDQGAGPITLRFSDDVQGGPTELRIGTAGADTLTAGAGDSVLQGRGGDDALDVSASGATIVVFDSDAAANGTDTVTGFTTGDTSLADTIAFTGAADLRGAGDTVQALAGGAALGADTGFVVFTTALSDTRDATLEAAAEGLGGTTAGDAFYLLAGDGTDAALARAEIAGPDDASVAVMAGFEGIGDLAALRPDAIILPDQTPT
ncbi:Ig-like domain [Rhodosalinus sediminis]|uniref:Ig-like domain n=1 Tax=Rhodosalinus sediminis TaxID=1940533 RepID=A0A3D9BXH9_9RHOB|nr:Ig-like domain-containing protein [Rhodosalinus sediminis]REC58214.1 Ig-like domain [Rhodosalinus sediminis]